MVLKPGDVVLIDSGIEYDIAAQEEHTYVGHVNHMCVFVRKSGSDTVQYVWFGYPASGLSDTMLTFVKNRSIGEYLTMFAFVKDLTQKPITVGKIKTGKS